MGFFLRFLEILGRFDRTSSLSFLIDYILAHFRIGKPEFIKNFGALGFIGSGRIVFFGLRLFVIGVVQ